jgi:hypothetical protein
MRKLVVFIVTTALAAASAGYARADHPCDPVEDAGWKVVPSHETVDQKDGAPYQEGTSGNWFIDRTTTVLPYCSYFDELGIYSMRSYSLSPESSKQTVAICRSTPAGGTEAIPPYAGACPPR